MDFLFLGAATLMVAAMVGLIAFCDRLGSRNSGARK
jgi:hypothetical protein